MFIVFGTVTAVIFTIIGVCMYAEKKSFGKILHIFLKNEFVINLISMLLLHNVFKYKHIVDTSSYNIVSFIKYFILSVLVGVVYLFIMGIAEGKLVFEIPAPPVKKNKGAVVLKVFSVIFVLLGTIMYYSTVWGKVAFGDVGGDQFIINLFSPTEGTETSVYIDFFEGPFFNIIFITTFFALLVFSRFDLVLRKKNRIDRTVINDLVKRLAAFILSLAVLGYGAYYCIEGMHLKDVYLSYFMKSDFIEDNYSDPKTAKLKFPEKKRNLIHIYLESVENSYLSKDLGGYMDKNLMPELTELAYEGYVFSDNDTKFGGPLQPGGTQWSIASMVNQATGMPMKTPDKPNSYGTKDNFLPGAYTLYDLLKEEGYEQTVMFGASANFGGLRYFFETHGDVKIMDYRYALDDGLIPPDYKVWWGYEDDKLYEFAKDEITRLYETGKPFNFTMETADTHRPHGYLSPKAPKPYDDQYANVIAYSTSEAVKFVRWIQQQPFYDNTTIVIIGDHLSMDTDFFKDFDEDYFRTQFNLVLNPAVDETQLDKKVLNNRQFANYDMYPTILRSLGVEIKGDRLGVGTDLFSGEKTVIEEYGFEKANTELKKKSEFYNEKILGGKFVPRSLEMKKH